MIFSSLNKDFIHLLLLKLLHAHHNMTGRS